MTKSEGGKKKLPVRFEAEVDYNDNSDVVVTISFADSKDKALVKSDGNANACLDMALYRYRPSF